MWRLFNLNKNPKEERSSSAAPTSIRFSAARLRILKDLQELSLPNTCSTEFADPDDLLNFDLIICPDEGYYRGGSFRFAFHVGNEYPYVAPKIKCLSEIFHPNIDADGNICLNILREEWKPVLTINSIIYGLQHLLLEPNHEDALNKEAGDILRRDPKKFAHMVYCSVRRSNNSRRLSTKL